MNKLTLKELLALLTLIGKLPKKQRENIFYKEISRKLDILLDELIPF